MKRLTLVLAFVAVASVVVVAALTRGREPGADVRWTKTSDLPAKFVKDQSRIPPEPECPPSEFDVVCPSE